MGTVDVMPKEEGAAAVAAARAGDESAFAMLAERYRPELQVHCYRMLGSFEDAEDLVQETFLRAWRRRATFEGRSSFRAWLYGIATNASLDAVAQKRRRATAGSEVLWLQPYPDRLLDAAAPREDEPDAVVVTRETIELAFLVALQHLPPTQRAVLIVRDVLGWSARETAALLETTVAAVNSALQRARATLRKRLPERRLEPAAAEPTEEERVLLERYMEAGERDDLDGLAETLGEEARFTMPPLPGRLGGPRRAHRLVGRGRLRLGGLRPDQVPAHARQPPAGGRQLPPPPRRARLPPVGPRRADARRRARGRHRDVPARGVPGVRAAALPRRPRPA